ncbi:hypothetical protein [Streptomyces sp. Tue6028]|uniref:fascin domain-containing protein n=1 Tax=Streptomyces sp. Tue6028 TaxID=2036037 RepID=UPI003EB980CD
MRRITSLGALLGLLFTLMSFSMASSAQAGDILTEKSAGRKFALESKAATEQAGTSICVTAEINDADNQYAKLRARTDCASIGSWETFTLHTDTSGARATLRSEANGEYVSAEFHDTGSHFGMLRARQTDSIGAWERFELVPQGDGWFALRYTFNENGVTLQYYVSAEINDTGGDAGLLRARKSTSETPGSWELFKLRQIAAPATPPAAASTPARSVHALTWNVCANNDACAMYYTSTGQFTDAVAQKVVASGADVAYFEEFCEKLAKPLEQEIERRLDGGADTWDVRFAPIQYEIGNTGQYAQKACAKNRGAYGVAIAVPAENSWYRAVELDSPDGKERRTALCAAVPSWAVMACTAHFSTGGANYDDPTRAYEEQQAKTLAAAAGGYAGYRGVFGGDLNATPTSVVKDTARKVLQPLYDSYRECDDPANRSTHGSIKLDYLFGPADATWSGCTIGSATDNMSDHQPIWGTVSLPSK